MIKPITSIRVPPGRYIINGEITDLEVETEIQVNPPPPKIYDPKDGSIKDIENLDALAELRREAVLVLGHEPGYDGLLSADVTKCHQTNQSFASTLGRVLLRYLNQRARAH